jgi:hypothetical protein
VLPVPMNMMPGEFCCYRGPAVLTEPRQTASLRGGYMAWESCPVETDEGEVYITTQRVSFSGRRQVRDISMNEIQMAVARDAAVELRRVGRPSPTLLAVPNPREVAAYIERAREEGAARLGSPLSMASGQAFGAPQGPRLADSDVRTTRVEGPSQPVRAEASKSWAAEEPRFTGPAPSLAPFVKCQRCGAANGLSANFCQNCAAPIQSGSTPTLNHPGPGAQT